MRLSPQAIAELNRWSANVLDACKPISRREPCMVITTDASKTGWGAKCQHISTGGLWCNSEANEHINYLELLATFSGLKTFAQTKSNIHIRLMLDNTSAVSFVNNMRTSHSEKSHILVRQLWEWCIERQIWVSAAHNPGRDNLIADFESRRNEKASEWILDRDCLANVIQTLEYTPKLDLFASRINKQFDNFVTNRPDPQASSIDAFTLTWSDQMFYAFPTFSVIGNVLKKIREEKVRGGGCNTQLANTTLVSQSPCYDGETTCASESVQNTSHTAQSPRPTSFPGHFTQTRSIKCSIGCP